MDNIFYYSSPVGNILLSSDEKGLTGLWFEGQKNFASTLCPEFREYEDPNISDAVRWLDAYFSGKKPERFPKIHLTGTEFRLKVWEILKTIPYGCVMSYGEIALKMKSSARAVGTAVGHNPISIIIPCHRVVGAKGALTGYAGGLEKKQALLRIEGALQFK